MANYTWSSEQLAIKNEFKTGKRHFVIRARAGVGKTTIAFEGIKDAPEKVIGYFAFNKRIEQEGQLRLKKSPDPRLTVKTIHALGLSVVKLFWEGVSVNMKGEREASLTEAVCGTRAPDAIKKLVSKLHTKGREILPHAVNLGELTGLAFNFNLLPEEHFEDMGFGLEYIEARALEAMELAATRKPVDGIDGSDMIFLPCRNHWLHPRFDLGVCDETQDLTLAQLEIVEGLTSGRIAIIGDDKQAIYGFRGADSGALDRLKVKLNAEEFPLTTTYRCGKKIVAFAQLLVPDFRAGENNPDGEVIELQADKLVETAAAGNFILSRLNAPLVSIAIKLLRAGKRAKVAGREYGTGLKTLVRKLAVRGSAYHGIPSFLARVKAWEEREVIRAAKAKRDARVEEVHDQADMLVAFADGAKNTEEIVDRIDALFTDDGLGDAGLVTCSSVHKAKGLEANRVFVLMDTIRNNSDEERNIAYVAYTRAKDSLVLVSGIGGR